MPRPADILHRAVGRVSWFVSSHPVITLGLAGSLMLLGVAFYQASTQPRSGPVSMPSRPADKAADSPDSGLTAAATGPVAVKAEDGPLSTTQSATPNFVDSGIQVPGGGAVAWGDYDNDGDLDLVLAGRLEGQPRTAIFRNDGGNFTRADLQLPAAWNAAVAWADYDHDGHLDLALAGQTPAGPICKLLRNDGAAFVEAPANLVGAGFSALAWGDFDNNASLDLVVMGSNHAWLYANQNGTFLDTQAALAASGQFGAVAWGDYDGDGDLDLFIIGEYNTGWSIEPVARLLRNDGEGQFTAVQTSLPALANAAAAWADFDGDGDLDLAIVGFGTDGPVSRIYRNHGNGQFTDIGAGLMGLGGGDLAWGDMDNDGDPDLVITGFFYPRDAEVPQCHTVLYRNDGDGLFSLANVELIGVQYGSVAWGDYDDDGDLDLVVSGVTSGYEPVTRIYRNEDTTPNTPPQPPGNLASEVAEDVVTFHWSPGSDAETPGGGLFYQLRIGSEPGRDDVYSGMADPVSGWRRIPATTGAQQRLSWTVRGLANPPYFWSVQTVDAAFAGSAWAPEAQIVWARVHNSTRDTFHMTIQEAVDAAQHEDVIVLSPGLYSGPGNWEIDLRSGLEPEQIRHLTIRGVNPQNPGMVNATVIDCQASPPRVLRRAFLFQAGEDRNTVLAGLTIRNAYAPEPGDGPPQGGAIHCVDSGPSILNCVFQNCGSSVSGGAIAVVGTLWGPSPLIRECTFTGNRADQAGGAISVVGGRANIERCLFKGNSAHLGGALYADGQGTFVPIDVWDCVFDANYATQYGGAMHLEPGSGLRAIHCTFANNVAQQGGGVYIEPGSDPVLANLILWGNRDNSGMGEYSQIIAHSMVLSYSHVQGWSGTRPGLSVSGADPLFEDMDGPDDDPATWADNNLRLQRKSPAINAATPVYGYHPETDVQGQPRVQSCQADIGAYESPWSYPLADYNRDCHVDMIDMRYLIMCALGAGVPQTDPSCADADLDLDGDVDITDFGIFQRCWSGPDARPLAGCMD